MSKASGWVRRAICILLAAIACGYILQVLVYLIPVKMMNAQKVSTAAMLSDMGNQLRDPVSGRDIDNYADSMTVLLATYDGTETVFEKAANSYYYGIDPIHPRQSLVESTLDGQETNRYSYGRYWHGNLLFMKTMLLFFDLAVIRNINTVFMFVLIAILLVFMWKKLREALIPFILMILLIAPTAAGQCFEYSFAVHIMLLASIFYLWNPGDFFSGERLYYLFLISGILLAYFDFMTAPTITLTFPLALVCLNEKRTWKSLIFCGVFWGIGYAGMWAGKWLIALISMKSEFFDDLTMHLHLWTAAELPEKSEEISRIETLNKNLRALFNSMEIDIALLVYSVAALLNTTLKRKDLTVVRIDSSLSLFLPGVIGIAWILVLASHSNVHTFFTYRTLAPCVFCMLCALNIGGFSIKRHFKEK